MKLSLDKYWKKAGLGDFPRLRKTVVGIVGATVLLMGIVFIFLPAPSFIVIPAGLAILATEFAWAGRYLERVQKLIERVRGYRKSGRNGPLQNSNPSSAPASTK